MAYTQDELKQQVAKAAVEYVKGGIIGVGGLHERVFTR